MSKHALRAAKARHAGIRRTLPRAQAWGFSAAIAFWAAAFVMSQGSAGGLPRLPAAVTAASNVAPIAAPIQMANAADTGVTYPAAAAAPSLQAQATRGTVIAPAAWLVPAVARQPASVGVPSQAPPSLSPAVPAWSGSGTIPRLALAAYINAAQAEAKAAPSCRLSWAVLAGIGLIESDHARGGGSRYSTRCCLAMREARRAATCSAVAPSSVASTARA